MKHFLAVWILLSFAINCLLIMQNQ